MWISDNNNPSLVLENVLVHFVNRLGCKSVRVKFKILSFFSIIYVEPQNVDLKLMLAKKFIPLNHNFRWDWSPLRKMKSQTVSWWHIGVARDIGETSLDSIRPKPATKYEEFHRRCFWNKIYKWTLNLLIHWIKNIDPSVSTIHPGNAWVTKKSMSCDVRYASVQVRCGVLTVREEVLVIQAVRSIDICCR